MTNEQKRLLRWTVTKEPSRTDADIADDIGCTKSTVRKYRKVFSQ